MPQPRSTTYSADCAALAARLAPDYVAPEDWPPERWVPAPEPYEEAYAVSSHGRVLSAARRIVSGWKGTREVPARLLKVSTGRASARGAARGAARWHVALCYEGVPLETTVVRLVLGAFGVPQPSPGHVAAYRGTYPALHLAHWAPRGLAQAEATLSRGVAAALLRAERAGAAT